MMSQSHNKKKNTALLFEFLTYEISDSLVKEDNKRSEAALKILKKYFKKNSELFKEYRIARALLSMRSVSEKTADTILSEAREAVKNLNNDLINESKRKLSRDIHFKIGESFYDHAIKDYKDFATVQQLFELWKSNISINESSANTIKTKFELEEVLKQRMTKEEFDESQHLMLSEQSPGVRRLIIKKMIERFNEKYGTKLNESQKRILKMFMSENRDKTVIPLLRDIKETTEYEIDKWIKTNSESEFINEKLLETKKLILEEKYDTLNEETVIRHFLYSDLTDELRGKHE